MGNLTIEIVRTTQRQNQQEDKDTAGTMGYCKKIGRARALGQSMIEFALAIPMLLLFLVGIAYFGRAFYVKQMVQMAAQEGARAICRIPNLKDPATRDFVRGFTTGGDESNHDSVIYSMLGSGFLLSHGSTGDLPVGAKVKILPWDSDGSKEEYTPPGTIGVLINYPFTFVGDQFKDNDGNVGINIWMGYGATFGGASMPNFTVTERAVVSQEVYQEVN